MATEFNYTREWTDAEAFPLLGFTKNWENPEDYPTYEPDEMQVRKDMQSLHDEVKDFLNNELIPRVIAEDATIDAWNAMEQARQEAESQRVSAETERTKIESARAQAESERAVAESGRVSAEDSRVSAETLREAKEAERSSAEAVRNIAEEGRVSAEAKRVGAESERRSEFTAMQSAESRRAEAERLRKQAETGREENETKRAAAESTRDRTFTQMKNLIENLDAEAQTLEAGEEATVDVTVDQKTGGYKIQFGLPRGYDGEGSGDMIAAVYDKHGKKQDVFEYADGKIAKTDIVQGTGKSTEAVMSQKAVTDAIIELSNYATPQMFGAVGDGVTDDTAAIQAALDAFSFVYIPDGTYMINATREGYNDPEVGGIKPHSGQTIVMALNATLKALPNSTGHYSVINLYGVENVKISGGKIEGEKEKHSGTTGEWGHGIMVRGCSDITIEGTEIFNCWGDSICTGYMYDSGANCKNVKIYNCKLHDSRRQGISVVSGRGVIIRDCEIYNISGTMPQSGIDIEPDGTVGVAENVIIDGCYIHDTANASIIIAQVTNKIKTLRITNCKIDTVMGLSGNDVVLNNNTIGTVQVSSDFINVANSVINRVMMSGGNGRFYNCQIVTEEDDALIDSDLSDYPNKTVDLVEFYGCLLRTPHQYLMEFGSMNTLTDGVYPEKMIRFNSCKIDFLGGTYPCFVERHPAELVLDNCDVTFAATPYASFNVKNMWDTKVVIRDSKFTWPGTADFIIDSGAYSNYTFEIFNNEFSNSGKFVRCSSAGTAGGTIRLLNNKMSNSSFQNNHKYTILGSNTEAETIAKTLAALPVYKGGVS